MCSIPVSRVAVRTLDNTPVPGLSSGKGALFGIAIAPGGRGVYFVDDGNNCLKLLHR